MKWLLLAWLIRNQNAVPVASIQFNNSEACLGAITAITETSQKAWTTVPHMVCVPQGN